MLETKERRKNIIEKNITRYNRDFQDPPFLVKIG